MYSSPTSPAATGRRCASRMWKRVPSTGLPIGMACGPSATVRGSTVWAEALTVVSVGPYRLTSAQPGRVAKNWRARVFDRASPPLKTWVSEVQRPNSSLSTRACSSVGTHWRAVTRCRTIVSIRRSGSRWMPGVPMTTRLPQAGARISHCAASKLMGVFWSTVVPPPSPYAEASHRIWLTMLRCSIMMPLGLPVLPDV